MNDLMVIFYEYYDLNGVVCTDSMLPDTHEAVIDYLGKRLIKFWSAIV